MTRGFQHLHIPVDDVEDENLIRYFPQAIDFIHKGLNYWPRKTRAGDHAESSSQSSPDGSDDGSGVLIHW